MPQYIGFSTINANKPKSNNLQNGIGGGVGSVVSPVIPGKKFRLVDEQLVIQDLVNAFNIPRGAKVGQPEYGTTLWDFVFDPSTADVQFKIEAEVRRVASLDPRLIVNLVKSYPQENGILIEVELAIAPFNNARTLDVYFDNLTSRATVQ
jgi:phage baseplate assembly protein W